MSVDPKSTYYDEGGIETISIIRAKLTSQQYLGYLLGNTLKYSCRLNYKGTPDRDADKLTTYTRLLLELLETDDAEDLGFGHLITDERKCQCETCTCQEEQSYP